MALRDKLTAIHDQHPLDVYEIAYLSKQAGDQVSPPYWYALMKGTKDNPSRKRIGVLATLFDLPWRYLADDEVNTPVEAILAEASVLSLEELRQVVDVLQQRLEAGE